MENPTQYMDVVKDIYSNITDTVETIRCQNKKTWCKTHCIFLCRVYPDCNVKNIHQMINYLEKWKWNLQQTSQWKEFQIFNRWHSNNTWWLSSTRWTTVDTIISPVNSQIKPFKIIGYSEPRPKRESFFSSWD